MKKKILAPLLVTIFFQCPAFAEEKVCLKTGRQFYIELVNYLGLQNNMRRYKTKFIELANNLPKKGLASEFAPSLASIIQLSDQVCTDYAALVAPRIEGADSLFREGDGLILTEIIGNEIFEKSVAPTDRDQRWIDNFLISTILDQSKAGVERICNFYIENATLYYGAKKIINIRNSRYCSDSSSKILQFFLDRKKQEAPTQDESGVDFKKYKENFQETYLKILRRSATDAEFNEFKNMEIKDENEMVYLSCIAAAASMEFISNGKCK
jgi:hypothetical protein